MNVYEDGDHVYLFGFSRGAYTVRALAGVIHMFGLLCPGNDGLIPYIIRLYAKRTRNAAGMKNTFEVADGFKFTFCRDCSLHFVGVWDTVSSAGWVWDPLKLPYTGQNPEIGNGRHAVSIDERRCYFRNSLWGDQLPGQSIKQVWFAGVRSDVARMLPPRAGFHRLLLSGRFVKRFRLDCWSTRGKPIRFLAGLLLQPFHIPHQSQPARRRRFTIL